MKLMHHVACHVPWMSTHASVSYASAGCLYARCHHWLTSGYIPELGNTTSFDVAWGYGPH